jgi:hypothetical protein
MKKHFITLATLLLFFSFSYGQKSNLVFFTEQGEPFYVIVNGIKQNADARSNVKVTDLTSPSYLCKIIFKNTELGQLDKTIYLNQGTETTYIIKKNNKNKWLIRWMNEAPVKNSKPSTNSYTYSNTEPVPEPVHVNTTQTQIQTPPNSANIGINVSDPTTGTNFNMNLNTNLTPNQANTTTTTTTTTTTNQGGTNSNPPGHHNHTTGNNHGTGNNQHQVTDAVPGYRGPYGCNFPMTRDNFTTVKNSVSSKNFESSKLTVAKQVITNNCLTTSQIKEIVKLFDFESTRLEFAKFAYSYVYDKGNYFQLNDAFDFESSIDELNNYIDSTK